MFGNPTSFRFHLFFMSNSSSSFFVSFTSINHGLGSVRSCSWDLLTVFPNRLNCFHLCLLTKQLCHNFVEGVSVMFFSLFRFSLLTFWNVVQYEICLPTFFLLLVLDHLFLRSNAYLFISEVYFGRTSAALLCCWSVVTFSWCSLILPITIFSIEVILDSSCLVGPCLG